MKYTLTAFTVLIVLVYGENVSVTLLSEEFQKGVETIDGPEKLAVHVFTNDFIVDFTNATKNLFNDLVLEYYRQALLASSVIVNDWTEATETLLKQARKTSISNSESLDQYLQKVSDDINKLLLIKIENSGRKEKPELQAIPSEVGPVLPHYENYEPEDLFNNLEEFVDRDMKSVFNFIHKIYVSGWQKSRLSLMKLQRQFRDQFFYCTILKAFLLELNKINATSNLIRNHVRPDSWNDYKKLSERVQQIEETVAISEICQTTKN